MIRSIKIRYTSLAIPAYYEECLIMFLLHFWHAEILLIPTLVQIINVSKA